MILTDEEIDQVQKWGASHDPREAGGLILKKGKTRRLACLQNTAQAKNALRHRPADIAGEERDGWTIQGYWHTHVRQGVEPSEADRAGCKSTGLPWIIVGFPNRRQRLVNPHECIDAPLIGREFSHGGLDCYTLIRDYYRSTCQIDLPDFHRDDDWWKNGQNVYMDGIATLPYMTPIRFMEASQVRQHDVLLMKINASVPNHGAVYLGASKMLHHFMGRLSERTFFSQAYQNRTTWIIRHDNFQ